MPFLDTSELSALSFEPCDSLQPLLLAQHLWHPELPGMAFAPPLGAIMCYHMLVQYYNNIIYENQYIDMLLYATMCYIACYSIYMLFGANEIFESSA